MVKEKNMFTIEQGYYIAYKFLHRYWEQVDKHREYYPNDSFTLVTVVGCGMDPIGVDDPRCPDPAKYEYWVEAMEPLGEKPKYTKDEVFQGVMNFLEYHRDEFEFNLEEAIADIKTQTIMWNQVVDEVADLIIEKRRAT